MSYSERSPTMMLLLEILLSVSPKVTGKNHLTSVLGSHVNYIADYKFGLHFRFQYVKMGAIFVQDKENSSNITLFKESEFKKKTCHAISAKDKEQRSFNTAILLRAWPKTTALL